MATNAELLVKVEAAIESFAKDGMQEWDILGRRFKRADIGELFKIRRQLLADIAAATQGGARTRLARPV